jgi:hypothetical protein
MKNGRITLSLGRLFVEPAQQSQRLQNYLNENASSVSLVEKDSGINVSIDLSRPKAVYRFGVTIEGLAALTAGRRYFEKLGLIEQSTPWAPSFSIGELRMLSKYLDSEVSFGHYLSRRYSIEELIDFIGDEQDLLSMYLTNGFCLLGDDVKAQPIMFINSDELVRTSKEPRPDRNNADILGVHLPPRWKLVAKEVYAGHPSIDSHKFDILFALMNQPPPSLIHLQKRISRWMSGGGGMLKSGEHSKYQIGNRQYIVMLNLLDDRQNIDPSQITAMCRAMGIGASQGFEGTSDCVVFSYYKRAKNRTYDGVSFFRLLRSDRPQKGPIIT